MTRQNFNGIKVFVGIDVHKKTYAVVALAEQQLVKKVTMLADPQTLIDFLRKHFPGADIESCYEAGFSGFNLHRCLVDAGIKNLVVHAASVEVSARDKIKTDKRDALKLATQLQARRLKGIYIPSREQEAKRELTRYREKLMQKRTQVANQIKHKCHYFGLIGPLTKERVSSKWLKELLETDLAAEIRFVIKEMADEWEYITSKLKRLQSQLKEQANEDEELEHVYTSAPGIGPTAARTLANELGDMTRFSSERALFSYMGLTPTEHSSGEHRRLGHISKQGKPVFRRILVQSAWIAIRHDPGLRAIYDRIARHAGGKKAIIGVARRLIGRIRSCFRKGELYKLGDNGHAAA